MYIMDAKHLGIIGTAAVAVFAGVYVLFGPSGNVRRKKRGTCPGLVNLGNTCFLNAILQAVAPCSSVVQWLDDFVGRQADYRKYLASTLHNVLGVLNNDSVEHTDEYSPSDVIDALHARRWVIPKDEQDAHELFHVLTATLDEESMKYPAVVPLFDVHELGGEADEERKYQEESEAQNRIHAKLPILPKREADGPFRGLLASQLQCKRCGHKYPVKYDTFDSISLTLPADYMGPLTLDHLLRQFIMPETVNNVECSGCAKKLGLRREPVPKTTFIKKLTIGKLPRCLCLHIQRTVWMNNGMPMKRFEHISFPEIMNMGEYVYHKKEPKKPTFLPLGNIDGEISARLVGGRNKNGMTKLRSPSITSPTITVPYSRPVNVLKALNYHTKTTMTGLSMKETQEPVEQSNSSVQRLAKIYSTETFSPVNTDHAYKLSSAVVHLGDVFSGHFVTYRRVPTANGQRFPDRWLYTSDTLVKKASFSEVMQANAYMLFYEKI